MIICPKCGHRLNKKGAGYCCIGCNYEAKNKSGIVFFNPEIRQNFKHYNAEYLNKLYDYESKHFWFIYRKQLILNTFQKYVKKNDSIIEIGAGTGDITRTLISNGYNNVSVGEIHSAGLNYAKKYGITNLYQFDINQSPFKNHFNVVGAFDVLEHLEDDDFALKKISRMLKKSGRVIITIPARKWLWSDIDRQSGHLKRYDEQILKKLFKQNAFQILSIKGFFILIVPLLIARSWLNKKRSNKKIEKRAGFTINPLANFILKMIMLCEGHLLKNATGRWAGSIVVVAKKLK